MGVRAGLRVHQPQEDRDVNPTELLQHSIKRYRILCILLLIVVVIQMGVISCCYFYPTPSKKSRAWERIDKILREKKDARLQQRTASPR